MIDEDSNALQGSARAQRSGTTSVLSPRDLNGRRQTRAQDSAPADDQTAWPVERILTQLVSAHSSSLLSTFGIQKRPILLRRGVRRPTHPTCPSRTGPRRRKRLYALPSRGLGVWSARSAASLACAGPAPGRAPAWRHWGAAYLTTPSFGQLGGLGLLPSCRSSRNSSTSFTPSPSPHHFNTLHVYDGRQHDRLPAAQGRRAYPLQPHRPSSLDQDPRHR